MFYESSDHHIYHVAIYNGNQMMIEAPHHNPDCSGIPVRQTAVRQKDLVGKVGRWWIQPERNETK